jgi:hypothetical protein
MAKRDVSFNVRAFWQSIQHQKCKKKLRGALVHLHRIMNKEIATEDMVTCEVYLKGKIGDCKMVKTLQHNLK